MPDDPKDKPIRLKVGTDPLGVPRIPTPPGGVGRTPSGGVRIPGRAITERGSGTGGGKRDFRKKPMTPSYIREELSRRVDLMENGGDVDFETEEFTPITTIAVVRKELKDDISASRNEFRLGVTAIRSDMRELIGVTKQSNEMFPKLVDQMMGMISGALANRQNIDLTMTERKLDIETNKVRATTEVAVESNRAKWLNIGKIISFVFSGAGIGLVISAILNGKC